MLTTDFNDLISSRMRAEHTSLAARWFERLTDLLPVDARHVFPSNSLLDHVPALITEIGVCLQAEHHGSIAANAVVIDKARELGALRHEQRASLHQVLREYQILGAVLVQFVLDEVAARPLPPPADVCVAVVARIHQAVDVLSQATVEAFVTLYTQMIADQNERLEQFTRMASHEWRQPLGALKFGVSLMRQARLEGQPAKTMAIIERNVEHLIELTHKLEAVARIQGGADSVVTQTVQVQAVAREAVRQLREMAEMREVDVRISDGLPEITVDVGRLELVLLNLLSNAIKYSDPAKGDRFVEVRGERGDGCCRIEVRDNGLGISPQAIGGIFRRFTRAHHGEHMDAIDGVGLGLSIVDDCVHSMGGRVEVESVEGAGTSFVVHLPVAAG